MSACMCEGIAPSDRTCAIARVQASLITVTKRYCVGKSVYRGCKSVFTSHAGIKHVVTAATILFRAFSTLGVENVSVKVSRVCL